MKNNYEKMKRNFHDNGFVVIRKLISKKQIKKNFRGNSKNFK